MCGIFGFSGVKDKAINLHKLMILGLYNESRGPDSCGYYFNGNIVKGIDAVAKFHDFIAKNKLSPGPLKTKVFMGHTRKSTIGAHSEVNAHPHVINNDYVQTHNGVIKDIWPLCKKHNVDDKGLIVDSIGLAKLIAERGPKPILDDYKGHAALAFTYMSRPEALYLYHGASRDKASDQLPWIERPLYYMYQPEGLYYSSMEDSLEAINSEPEKVHPVQLKCNIVFEVIDGELTENKLSIDREYNNVTYTPAPQTLAQYNDPYKSRGKGRCIQRHLPIINEEINLNDDILKEQLPPLDDWSKLGTVFYYQGKYWEILEYADAVGSEKKLYHVPVNGMRVLNRDGLIIEDEEKNTLDGREMCYYFISGWMIRSKSDFDDLVEDCISGVSEESFRIISTKSRYPVIQLHGTMNIGKNLWFHNGNKVNRDTFNPKFSKKKYKIRQGKTKQIYPGLEYV